MAWYIAVSLLGLAATALLTLWVRNRKQEQTLKEALTTARHANLMKEEFLAIMSHELRTPLTAILGYTELMLDGIGGPMSEECTDMLERVDTSSKHLLSLIEQILDISKARRGKLFPNYTRIDVKTLISRTAIIAHSMAERKGIQLYINVPADPVECDLDPGKFRQILLNLLGNAVKFTDAGSVTIELRATQNNIAMCIRDTGIGISPEDCDKIFDPFYRVDGGFARRREGAGLGLTITRELVECLEGTIRVRSEQGAGSEFEVQLPRYHDGSSTPDSLANNQIHLMVTQDGLAENGQSGSGSKGLGKLERDHGSLKAPEVTLHTNMAC